MESQSKKCPMCAEDIPLTTVTCEYCNAQFTVISTGYCQNCHQVQEADETGQCRVCGNAVMDLRVESRLIEGPAQKPLPISQPIAQTEIPKTRKSRLPFGILAGILVFAVVGAFLWFGRNSIPIVPSLFETSTLTVTTTLTPIAGPTATPTRTPRPTPTVTPIPAWVTEFAEPVLAAIEDRQPDFAEDFSRDRPGWQFHTGQFSGPENPGKMEILDGAMWMSVNSGSAGFAEHSRMRFDDFVLQVDADLLQVQSGDAVEIDWRDDQKNAEVLSIWRHGRWLLNFCGHPCVELASGSSPSRSSSSVTIIIISRGTEYAVYLNSHPLMFFNDMGRPPAQFTYKTDDGSPPNAYIKLSLWADHGQTSVAKYDNLKVWDLDKIQIQP